MKRTTTSEEKTLAALIGCGMPRHKAESVVRKARDIGRDLAQARIRLSQVRAAVGEEFADVWPEEATHPYGLADVAEMMVPAARRGRR